MVPVNIHITETGNKLEIRTVPWWLEMPTGKQTITFRLISNAYSFVANPAEAIQIEKKPGNQFKDQKGDTSTITVMDENTDNEEYKYTIRVEHKENGKVLIIDPLIKNH